MQTSKLSAEKLHKLGEKAREEDRYEESLELLALAIAKYERKKDFGGKIDCLHSRLITYKHLYTLYGNKTDLDNAISDVQTSLRIAKKHKLKSDIFKCYFNTGEVSLLVKNYKKAVVNFRKALKYYSGTDSERGRFDYHLGESLYRSGKRKEGKLYMLLGLKEIEEGRDIKDSFVINVWGSGCLMRLAELLREDDHKEAKKYLEKAQKIIKFDKRLIIRKRQLEELEKLFED